MAAKHMCEWKKKDLEKNMKKFIGIVKPAKFACAKCKRVANDKKYLCKPVALK